MYQLFAVHSVRLSDPMVVIGEQADIDSEKSASDILLVRLGLESSYGFAEVGEIASTRHCCTPLRQRRPPLRANFLCRGTAAIP